MVVKIMLGLWCSFLRLFRRKKDKEDQFDESGGMEH